ncbi:MAG TPA: hypothetical protein VG674_32940 [Amycolatopsis sp.]|nr:hypothetical protein [Amycolatopsis sp.]
MLLGDGLLGDGLLGDDWRERGRVGEPLALRVDQLGAIRPA